MRSNARIRLKGLAGGYEFTVPLLEGDHVTDDTGTGFVHTAPGHGREDFDIWTANARELEARGINTTIPYTVDENGALTAQAPGFEGKRVIDDKGNKGDANEAVIKALIERGMLLARGRLKHQYPHSWRSKKPVIFRNTPQWFIAMDKDIADDGMAKPGDTLRARALQAISVTQWVPPAGQNRITGMIAGRPDWVISRQRAWGVPIAVFVREKGDGSAEILQDEIVNQRIVEAFMQEGADAWYLEGARERFLGPDSRPRGLAKVDDILDVWFDSGSTHAFVLEDRQNFPGLGHIVRKIDGGQDTVMYLEGCDQHRGWFHSSLLESSGTRGRAPYDIVLTHGFTLDENGRKMSKSLGNTVEPQKVIKDSGADILRLWVCATDYADDQRVGPEILKNTVETYRKLRNTIRWMLGSLAHFRDEDRVKADDMPELERLMLHRLSRGRRDRTQRLCGVRLQDRGGDARRVHEHRTLGVLFRYPQGHAVLRSAVVDGPQSGADGHRLSIPLDRDLACAGSQLHRGRSLDVALSRCRHVSASRTVPENSRGLAQRRAGNEVGNHPWRAKRRHRRTRSRTRRQADRLVAGGIANRLRQRPRHAWHVVRCRSCGGLHHIELRSARRRSAARRVPFAECPWGCRGGRKSRGHQMRPFVENPADRRRGQGVPRRVAARCAGVAGMEGAGSDRVKPAVRFGIIAAVIALVADQASKLWLLFVFDIGHRGAVSITPFFDLVLAWNTGISYGWFQNESPLGAAILLAIKAAAVVLLAVWMARSHTRMATIGLGLIIGGAIGNAIDRLAYGAVVDFALFHIQIGEKPSTGMCLTLQTWRLLPG